MGGKGVGA